MLSVFDHILRTVHNQCIWIQSRWSHSELCEVPQGSVLGPILFTLYTADVGNIIRTYQLLHHCYADDVQVLRSCKLDERDTLKANALECIQSVATWMASNQLKFIPAKSEYMWCMTARQLQVFDSELNIFHHPAGNVEVSACSSISRLRGMTTSVVWYVPAFSHFGELNQ